MDNPELYCKIYISTAHSRTWLLQQVAEQMSGEVAGRTVQAAELIVDVSANEDYDAVNAGAPDGFVYFPYYLDVTPADEVARSAYVTAVGRLLLGLSRRGTTAVASSDFETELPSLEGDGRRES